MFGKKEPLIDLIKSRRSIRKFQVKEVPDELLNKVLEAGLWAPSSNHSEPVEFIIVKNEKTKKELSNLSQWSGFLKKAPLNIAVIVKDSHCLIEDGSAAVMSMMLEAHSLGLGTCWIDCKDAQDFIKRTLEIPKEYKVITVLPLGYPSEYPSSKRKTVNQSVRFETHN